MERDSNIQEAWLNSAGTKLAVVAIEHSTHRSRFQAVQTVLDKHNVKFSELKSPERKAALKELQSGQGWFRASEVGKLSEQEAGILAARLVRRLREKIIVTDDTANALEHAFADVFKRRFIGGSAARTPGQREDELRNVVREFLGDQGLSGLEEALKAGLRPRAGER